MKFFRSPSKLNATSVLLLLFFCYYSTDAFDAFDPNGNITIKWDVISWTPDGYVALVTINNFQQYRLIQPPGWSLKWTWAKDEVIWSMLGSQTTEQGNCSKFNGDIPHCFVNSWGQDPSNSISSFQLSVGSAGTTNNTVRIPKNFTLNAPGPGYTCGPAKIVKPTKFIAPDGRGVTQAMSKLIRPLISCSFIRCSFIQANFKTLCC
ncbi:hypothetical protein R3W88_007881 [Solanum pinnatisectum]|uniref:COBRA-like protein n=1 Tax=Solanum pinnatisectum TaxID=50273 RepID=A0AAV9M9D8_9SOLN|nr:hypothetical protein R3W88_007881 [Solanum pinnatisectum]